MALRNILLEGDETLRKPSRRVDKFNKRLEILLDDMRETLINANGLGLAAPQVGVLRRVVVIMGEDGEILELVNPEIVSAEGEQDGYEGCLSIPDTYGLVVRPMKVTVRAFDRSGNEFEVTGEGLTARAFSHEIDHLDGKLYIDKAYKMLSIEELEALLSAEADGQQDE
ncbi:MAG: peptide deformylase, partial [Oscillospiraceae bacterium]